MPLSGGGGGGLKGFVAGPLRKYVFCGSPKAVPKISISFSYGSMIQVLGTEKDTNSDIIEKSIEKEIIGKLFSGKSLTRLK